MVQEVTHRNNYFWRLFVFIILFSLVLYIQLRLQEYIFDDAYIHFRISRNFVDFGVPYFNPSERVMASSSTGWTLVVSALFLIAKKPVLILVFNALATSAGAAIFSYALSKSWDWILYALIYIGLILPASIGLMETPLTMLLVSIAYTCYLQKKPLALIMLGVLPFFRLELVFLSAVFLVHALLTRRYSRLLIFLLPFFAAIPFLIFDVVYFHTIIPNTIYAKSNGYTTTVFYTFLMTFQEFIPGANLNNIFFWIIMVPPTIYWGWRIRKYFSNPEGLLLLTGVLIVGFYLAGRTLIFKWYGPLYTIIMITPTAKAFLLNRKLPSLVTILVFVIPIGLSLGQTVFAAIVNPSSYQGHLVESRVPQYIRIGEKLYQQFPNARLMTSEIGGLGWGFKGYIFDGFGLASPDAIHHQTKQNGLIGGIPLDYITEKNPEIIVSHRIFIEDFLSSSMKDQYENFPVNIFPNEGKLLWGDSIINVFVRKDLLDGYVRNPLLD